jgi:tRNA 2-thiocytidine biosynthesis protein TtcA
VLSTPSTRRRYCGLCSRLRRGILYTHTQQIGAQRLALGHHRDDALETLLLNMVHQGTMKAMPARYMATRGVDVIRPLMYCAEDDLREYATRLEFPILPCNLCGSQPVGKPSQRQGAKQLLHFLDAFGGDGEDVRENMLRALSDVRPSHLLDRDLRGACGLDPCTGEPVDDRASRIFRAPGGDDDDELGIRR